MALSPLLYCDTERSADARFFGGVYVPDPFIAFGLRGKKYAVVSALEFGRVKRDSDFDVVLPLEAWLDMARREWPRRPVGAAEIVALLARRYRIPGFVVPEDFFAGMFQRLRKLRVKVDTASGMLFPERETKTAAQAAKIKEGNRASAAGIAAAERVLRHSRIKRGKLIYEGAELTSERLKTAIEVGCIEAGAVAMNSIAAGGDQGCDPHSRGSGALRPNELIVVDVFPQVSGTGYFGDMTRTFLRGRASDAQRALVEAVRAAQIAALQAIRAGVPGTVPHAAACAVFKERGFETKTTANGSVGFIHGTGHGLGLEIHEPPRLSPHNALPLKVGAVVTVEPGLYYPGVGGCRIEDVVHVTAKGADLLSAYPYEWELK